MPPRSRTPRRVFGEIPGQSKGVWFPKRAGLAKSGIHRPTVSGISGSASEGADSIVAAGGYEDDEDYGDYIIYTGDGGQKNKRQAFDQQWKGHNLALAKSCDEGLPVRVVRGNTAEGYRYDGLFRVERYWRAPGLSGFMVCRFRLVELTSDSVENPSAIDGMPENIRPATRVEVTTQRLVRNTAISQGLKVLYSHTCQICGIRLATLTGFYSEGAHIRPLGRPHDGPDSRNNILCLCPNHHVLFDSGAIHIRADLTVVETFTNVEIGPLKISDEHELDANNLTYHRTIVANILPPNVKRARHTRRQTKPTPR